MSPVLSVQSVTKIYASPERRVVALDEVSVDLYAHRTTAIVGESGCGKSTLGRLCVALDRPDQGHLLFQGKLDLATCSRRQLRKLRPSLQMVFQDPYASFAPHLTLRQSFQSVMAMHRGRSEMSQTSLSLREAMEQVGLREEHLARRPHQLSGGQLQRASLARALSVDPVLLVADENVSSLDVAAQDELTQMMRALQAQRGFTLVFITHDLGLAREIADDICVLHRGTAVEHGPTQEVLESPVSPETRRLINAVPRFRH